MLVRYSCDGDEVDAEEVNVNCEWEEENSLEESCGEVV